MRLPTLNVDVKVNTSTMKKDIERANKQLQGIGGKAAAFAGGGFLALCDGLTNLLPTRQFPVGVLTPMLGGPFFLALLLKEKRRIY